MFRNCCSLARQLEPVETFKPTQISEAVIWQVATVTGFDDELDITDDIGAAATVILASSSETRQNPWIHNVAKFHKLSILVIKTNTWLRSYWKGICSIT
uniref:Phosphotyrosine protein phosphatase domain-containing protein n=1 Tax=Arundo donax TaxID=35708 RepID=A0A0A8YZQ2_ARUDO